MESVPSRAVGCGGQWLHDADQVLPAFLLLLSWHGERGEAEHGLTGSSQRG